MNRESLLKALQEGLAELVDSVEYDGEVGNEMNFNVVKGNVTIKVYYDVSSNVFGFHMLQGGVKNYPDFNQFIGMFKVYVYINTVFVPRAKIVADMFEKSIGVNTVYQTFSGNVKDGFVAIFKVLGRGETVVVKEFKGYFTASFVNKDEEGNEDILSTYKYILGENNVFTQALTIDVYIDALYAKYGESDAFDISRVSDNEFTIEADGINFTYVTEVLEEQNTIKYTVVKCNDDFVDQYDVVLDDYMDLEALLENVRSHESSFQKGVAAEDESQLASEDIEAADNVDILDEASSASETEHRSTEDVLYEKDMEVLIAGQESRDDGTDSELSDEQKEAYENMNKSMEEMLVEGMDDSSDATDDSSAENDETANINDVASENSENTEESVETDDIAGNIGDTTECSSEEDFGSDEEYDEVQQDESADSDTVDEVSENSDDIPDVKDDLIDNIDESDIPTVEEDSNSVEEDAEDNTDMDDIVTEEVNTSDESTNETPELNDTSDVSDENSVLTDAPSENLESGADIEMEGNMEEPTVEIITTDAEESVVASKLMTENDELMGIVINTSNDIFIINEEALKKYKFPFKRLVDTEKMVKSRGMLITESEKRRGIFAEDVSDNDEEVARLIKLLF